MYRLIFRTSLLGLCFFGLLSFADDDEISSSDNLDLSRRESEIDLSRPAALKMRGRIVFKQIDAKRSWPFFVANGNKEYKIETSNEDVQEEIAKCKGGEPCEIIGVVREGDRPSVKVTSFQVVRPDKPTKYEVNFDDYFVKVEPRDFTMGSPISEPGRRANEVEHIVAITKPFEIGKAEVTLELWMKVMRGEAPYPFHQKIYKASWLNEANQYPVVHVNFLEVEMFMDRLNHMRRGDDYNYRLATEAEWEFSARGGHRASAEEMRQAYWFGNSSDLVNKFANIPDTVGKIKQFPPNKLGLYDMNGNAAELTLDRYTEDHSKTPIHPEFGHPVTLSGWYGEQTRVVRGGPAGSISSSQQPLALRSAYREARYPAYTESHLGLRIVRTRN